jgi:hypothetical protein
MGPRITFTGNADLTEPMSAMVRRKWEDGRVYHGVLLELYRINGDVYGRAVYTDTQVCFTCVLVLFVLFVLFVLLVLRASVFNSKP